MKFFEKLIKKESEKEELQRKCTHDWLDVNADVLITNYSIIGFIAGPTKLRVITNLQICKLCDKVVVIEI